MAIDGLSVLLGLLVGAAGSLLALGIANIFTKSKSAIQVLGEHFSTALRLREGGITRFILRREQYPMSLNEYLREAEHSIRIVSISLKVRNHEEDLIELFRRRLVGQDSFEVSISLLDPGSSILKPAARALNLSPEDLRTEIEHMLGLLVELRQSLPPEVRERLSVDVHDTLPMGSAILLDATPSSGRIQVETKLHRAPRIESFGYEVEGPTEFYRRHYRAWRRMLEESDPYDAPTQATRLAD